MEHKRNKIYFSMFMIIILLVVVGGYFYMHKVTNKKEIKTEVKKPVVELKESRIVKSKDYIYFVNAEELEESEEIFYEEIVINIKGHKDLENTLNEEFKTYKNSIDKTDEEYKLPYRLYEIIDFDNYISLIIKDYTFNKEDHIPTGIKGYIFSKEEGKLITEEEILEEYSQTLSSLKEKVKDKIVAFRIEEDLLDDTMNSFNHFVYVNKIGNLEIAYLVKSTLVDYYDKITLD